MYYIFNQTQADSIAQVVQDNTTAGAWTVDPYAGALESGDYAVAVSLGEEVTRRGISWEPLLSLVGIDINTVPQEEAPTFIIEE